MTASPFDLVVNRALASVRVSGISAPFTGSLASNILSVQYSDDKGGSIIFNDRPPLPEAFSDPSPYQSAVNDWITATAALGTNPLTLAQAMAVKCAFINAIGTAKKNAPVPVTVGGTPYTWSADGNAALLGGLSWVVPLNNVIAGVEALYSSANGALGTFASGVGTSFSGAVTSINGAFSNLKSGLDFQFSTAGISVTTPSETVSASGPSAPTITNPGLTTLSVPTLQAVPVGGTSPVALTGTDVQNIVSAIVSQASTVQGKIAAKQGAVNVLSTIAAVVSYDATTGW